jgi:predicted O-methyltransferase YrrM
MIFVPFYSFLFFAVKKSHPVDFLKACSQLLRDGGLVMILIEHMMQVSIFGSIFYTKKSFKDQNLAIIKLYFNLKLNPRLNPFLWEIQ